MINTTLTTSNLDFRTIKKPVYATKLNLVALMDIFTILVFFLLMNAGDAERLENAKFVKLPDSSAKAAPHVEAVIMIGQDDIWLNNEKVAEVQDVLKSGQESIAPLSEALRAYTEKRGELTTYEKENGLAVTIMGDQDVSFSLLKSVMSTCNDNDFRDISLAVNRIASQSFLMAIGEPVESSAAEAQSSVSTNETNTGG